MVTFKAGHVIYDRDLTKPGWMKKWRRLRKQALQKLAERKKRGKKRSHK